VYGGDKVGTNLNILLVEDNPADVLIIRRVMARAGLEHHLTVIEDGEAAVRHFQALAALPSEAEGLPDLVVLDLNIPRLDGFEVLRILRSCSRCGLVPVVVMSTSVREEEVQRAYRLGASSFVEKSPEFDLFATRFRQLLDYWSEVVRLPGRRLL
jgi:CheY-like chemotaxis protein